MPDRLLDCLGKVGVDKAAYKHIIDKVDEHGGDYEKAIRDLQGKNLDAFQDVLQKQGIKQKVETPAEPKLSVEQPSEPTQPPPSTPPAEAPEVKEGEGKTTSIKNETTAAEREARGKAPIEIEEAAKRSFPEVWDEAKKKVDSGEINIRDKAERWADKPRALNAEESAALLYDRMRLSNQYDDINEQITKAQKENNQDKVLELEMERLKLERDMEINDKASRRTGYEQGLGLAIRKMITNQDYSLAKLRQRATAAAGGEVPKETMEKIEKLASDLKDATKKNEEFEKRTSNLEAQIEKLKNEARQDRRNKRSNRDFKSERKDIVDKIKNKWKDAGKDNLAVSLPYAQQLIAIAPEVGKLIKSYAAEGITKLSDLIDRVHEDLHPHIPDLTKDDIKDILAGKYKPEPKMATPEQVRLRANMATIKRQIDFELDKLRLSQRSTGRKVVDYLHAWQLFSLLSGIPTLGKIGGAVIGRAVTSPTENLIGQGIGKLLPNISKGAPREGRLSPKAEAEYFKKFVEKATRDEFWKTLKTGTNDLEQAYGNRSEHAPVGAEWMEFFGRLHAAIKSIPKRAEFYRSLQMRTEHALKENPNLDLKDPKVQSDLTAAAYNDALRAVFMQENYVSDKFKGWTRELVNSDEKGKQFLGHALEFMLPITKVPMNYVAEESSYLIGGLKAAVALLKGVKNLKPEEKDAVMRALKKQAIGAAFMAIGYFNSSNFGGYYTGKRNENDLKAGDIHLFGVTLPHWMSHTPLLEALQFGATLRRVRDAAKEKGKEPSWLTASLKASVGVINQTPFVNTANAGINSLQSWDNFTKYLDRMAGSAIEPQIIQNIAKWTDKDENGDPIKRDPKNLLQQLESTTPGLEKNVPQKSGISANYDKDVKELMKEKGVIIPMTKRVPVKNGDNLRPMTDKEFSDFTKLREGKINESLKQLKENEGDYIGDQWVDLKKMTPAQLKTKLKDYQTAATKEAKEELFNKD